MVSLLPCSISTAIVDHYGLADFSTAVICERADLFHVFLCLREGVFLFFLDHVPDFIQDEA